MTDQTLEDEIIRIHGLMADTEEKDVDFFLDRLASCDNEQKARELIKSFRRQMIVVAAGEALASRT